jgi:hypothetical protein
MDQSGRFGGFKFDKLTASNYHTWKQKIELGVYEESFDARGAEER